MRKLLFFDTETTGLGEEDRLFQVAYKMGDREASELFRPPLPIHPGAAEVTGVSDEDVVDKPVFVGSAMYGDLLAWSDDSEVIFVAHNAPFDTAMMQKEGISIDQVIDTYKIARAVDPEMHAPSYKLESLCEFYGVDVSNFQAHDAMGDVEMLALLWGALSSRMEQEGDIEDAVSEALRIMSEPLLIRKMPFGKYKSALIEEIAAKDGGYLEWLLSAKRRDAEEGTPDIDWIYTLSYYLGKKCEYDAPEKVKIAKKDSPKDIEEKENESVQESLF